MDHGRVEYRSTTCSKEKGESRVTTGGCRGMTSSITKRIIVTDERLQNSIACELLEVTEVTEWPISSLPVKAPWAGHH
jgi:hypothetical protein